MSNNSNDIKIWVTHSSNEWEFSEQMLLEKDPTVIHLLKAAVKTFKLPENDASVKLLFNNETVSNRKLLSSFNDNGTGFLEFELVHLDNCLFSELKPTKFLSPLDFLVSNYSFNDEAMMSEIIYLEGEHLLVNKLVFNELRYNASVSNYIPVIGALGNTGTGKSLIMASLLGKDGRIPIVRRTDQNESTTANCNLFYSKNRTQIFLDFEGECGTDPSGLRSMPLRKYIKNKITVPKKDKKVRDKKLKDIKKEIQKVEDKKKNKETRERRGTNEEKREKRKSQSLDKLLLNKQRDTVLNDNEINLRKSEDIKKVTRREVVSKLLPKLAYIICDVLLFVTTDEIHADYSVYDRCMAFAMRANAFIQDTDRPALVIVHNKYNVSLNNLEKELDVNTSTTIFLETFDPDLKLAGYFSAVHVVRLPMIGEAYDNSMLRRLWDQQIDRLQSVLNTCKNNRSQHRIAMSCQLTNKLWYRFVEVIVKDMVYDKPISAAKHVQEIIHMEFEEHIQPLINLFHKVYDRKPRTIEWFYQCARFTVDTLGRLWGISLRDGGYDIEQNNNYGEKILSQLMESLDKMKPCTAYHPSRLQVQCTQTKALHVCHRANVNESIKSRYRKILAFISQKGLTMTWEGNFTFIDNEKERDSSLQDSFWKTALCFATNDVDGIQEAMRVVLEHPDYRSCIWETLLLGAWDSDQELRSWAKRLVVDSMRLLDIDHVDNIWEKAVSDWEYLNVLCKKIPHENITLKRLIGNGTFADVYEGMFLIDKEIRSCAVKVISSRTKGFNLNMLRQEIAIMSLIEDKSLLRLYGYCDYKESKSQYSTYYLVLDLMDGTLQHWLKSEININIEDILLIASQIAEGIQTLHNHNIIHRDIKPTNILLRKLGRGYQAVLADMGLARRNIRDPMTVGVGTYGYIAPEIYEKSDGDYDDKVDIYSFGKLLEDLVNVIPNDDTDIFLSEIKKALLHLVGLCCKKKPTSRTNIIFILYRLKEFLLQIYSDSNISDSINENSEGIIENIHIDDDSSLSSEIETLNSKNESDITPKRKPTRKTTRKTSKSKLIAVASFRKEKAKNFVGSTAKRKRKKSIQLTSNDIFEGLDTIKVKEKRISKKKSKKVLVK